VGIGHGFGASLAWRVEGMPRYDLIGRSDGFRRPGLEMFIEPGISYSRGASSFSFSMPWGYYRNRKPDAYTGALGDATFPRFIVLGTYSVRFGGLKNAQRPLGPGTVGDAGNAPVIGGGSPGAAATLSLPSLERGQEMVRLDVTGMTCDVCVETVQTALQNIKGVVSAKVSLAQHEAVVVYEPAKTSIAEIEKTVDRAKGMNPYTAKAETATVTLAISGMTCDVCVETVQTALAAVKGVTEATVSLQTHTAVVTYAPAAVKVTDLLKAVKNAKGMNPYSAKVQQD
jgi:copper ion binding protein